MMDLLVFRLVVLRSLFPHLWLCRWWRWWSLDRDSKSSLPMRENLSHGTLIGLSRLPPLHFCLSPMVVGLRFQGLLSGRFIQRTLQKTSEKRLIQSNDQQPHVPMGEQTQSQKASIICERLKMTVLTFRSKKHRDKRQICTFQAYNRRENKNHHLSPRVCLWWPGIKFNFRLISRGAFKLFFAVNPLT